MKIPRISRFQWHSYSIVSSSNVDHDTMSVIIKCEGSWTNSLYNIIHAEAASGSDHGQHKCIPISLEGPYGPSSMDFLSRHDSLLLVAGGIGVTPFLSILQEIASAQSRDRNNLPSRIQLIYTVKKCQDVCLLNPVMPLLLGKNAERLHLKLKVFVTQESQSGVTVGELLREFSQVQTVNFDTNCSSYATYGLESLFWMAAIVGLSSILFLFFLGLFNHIFLPHAKKTSKQKNPSSETDLLLACSFILALIFSTFVAVFLRRRKLGKALPSLDIEKQGRAMKLSSIQSHRSLEEHEIHFGGRPNLEDIFSKFPGETGGTYIRVLVCGPETMKESVASLCQLSSAVLKNGAQRKTPYFRFHSLNFTL